jgi:four helix bundle protein
MAESIEQLRIYKTARQAEDDIYELVKTFPAEQFYGLGNDLRRSSAAVSHYIMETHRLFSYRLKLDSLAGARREAESTLANLESARTMTISNVEGLTEQYKIIIRQSWGLTKWLEAKLEERQKAIYQAAASEQA